MHALWDPATGYNAALSAHRQFPGSALLSRYGEGHGSLLTDAESLEILTEYLLTPEAEWQGKSLLVSEPWSNTQTDFEMMGWAKN